MSSRRRVLYCEMCGLPVEDEPYVIYVEGSEMYVCERCYNRYISRARSTGTEDVPLKARISGGGATRTTITPASRPSPALARPSTPRPSTRPVTPRPGGGRGRGLGSDRLAERYEVVPDFAERVRRARERLGLSQEELAVRVKERVNVIKRIEAGTLVPTVDLARRLEKVLGIKLLEPVVEEDVELGVSGSRRKRSEFELTLGDIVEIREE
ncbi:transcriptional regulator, XRE family [Pyrolobus fumarii 1A]|uniref:Transcriptional regulator, XRE family n=1 Tax=Pyrolobus fumarii (strain DSM 11204 / 1A) TaxID=694429 RepID=G0EER6_PYRF1|nr:multiprotein bridging factor aMBF1 [Pyrolobus fumarii]AEM38888.1 transcriptional regulator, XRE family [Pyrolobus fumarii 1A]